MKVAPDKVFVVWTLLVYLRRRSLFLNAFWRQISRTVSADCRTTERSTLYTIVFEERTTMNIGFDERNKYA